MPAQVTLHRQLEECQSALRRDAGRFSEREGLLLQEREQVSEQLQAATADLKHHTQVSLTDPPWPFYAENACEVS